MNALCSDNTYGTCLGNFLKISFFLAELMKFCHFPRNWLPQILASSMRWLVLVLCWLALPVVPTKLTDGVQRCLREYLPKIERFGLCPVYLDTLRAKIDANDVPEPIKTRTRIIVDLGLGSLGHSSEVFQHLMQLNISGFDPTWKSSLNCEFDSVSSADKDLMRDNLLSVGSRYVQVSQHLPNLPKRPLFWFDVLSAYPNSLVLVNDISDEDYFNNQHSAICNSGIPAKDLPESCMVPMVMFNRPHGFKMNLTYSQLLLSSYTLEQVKSMTEAYRSLISCIVPREQMVSFNLRTSTSVQYWFLLTKFLDIRSTSADAKYLTEMGSVCEKRDPLHKKWVDCANTYGKSIGAIYGRQFYSLVRNVLLRHPPYPHERRESADTQRLVLGVGPGTSGTRSVHFSMVQLGITGLHFQSIHARPEIRGNISLSDFEYDMKILTKESADRRVYWSDTPVPNHWWYLHRMYPQSSYIMTDVRNVTSWHLKRLKEHCNKTIQVDEPSCFPPLPIRYDGSPLSHEFFTAVHLKVASLDQVVKTYEAYRSLLRCAIPQKQLYWVYLIEAKDSKEYWSRLFEMSNAALTSEQKAQFITKGIPRCGTKGCYWGGERYSVHY